MAQANRFGVADFSPPKGAETGESLAGKFPIREASVGGAVYDEVRLPVAWEGQAGVELALGYSTASMRLSLRRAMASLAGISLAGAVAASLLLIGLINGVVARPLARMTALAERAADGDLTQGELPAEGGDEIGRLGRVLNRLLRDQRDTVKQVSEASGHLSRAAADLMQISRGSTQNISQLVNIISQISSTPSRR